MPAGRSMFTRALTTAVICVVMALVAVPPALADPPPDRPRENPGFEDLTCTIRDHPAGGTKRDYELRMNGRNLTLHVRRGGQSMGLFVMTPQDDQPTGRYEGTRFKNAGYEVVWGYSHDRGLTRYTSLRDRYTGRRGQTVCGELLFYGLVDPSDTVSGAAHLARPGEASPLSLSAGSGPLAYWPSAPAGDTSRVQELALALDASSWQGTWADRHAVTVSGARPAGALPGIGVEPDWSPPGVGAGEWHGWPAAPR